MLELSLLEEELLREHFKDEIGYNEALNRLEDGDPFAYVIGEWYFYSETYKVSPDCLIPRPDTEHIVDYLIKNLPENAVFADLCTGSGCIAISTLKHRPDVKAIAIDISEGALALAKENSALNGVSDRISFVKKDVLKGDCLSDMILDAISANPPYIPSGVIPTLSEQVRREPIIALDGGGDGLDFYRVIFDSYKRNVKSGGFIVCEIGYDQGEAAKELFGCKIYKDYGGNDRVAVRLI